MNSFLSNLYPENREWIRFAAKWFVFAAFVGALAFVVRPSLIQDIVGVFEDKFGPEPLVGISLAREIFVQNTVACLLALLGGVLFGISSMLIVFTNGFIIGVVVMYLLLLPGNVFRNVEYILLGLGPHGLFELPAFILASALGLRLGTEWLAKSSRGRRWEKIKENSRRVLYSLPVLGVLLIIAAIIEVFVSSRFIENF